MAHDTLGFGVAKGVQERRPEAIGEVRPECFFKPGRLSPGEFAMVKRHAERGASRRERWQGFRTDQ
jgi:hypothetical protein